MGTKMKLLFENWRNYMNEGGARGHHDTDNDGIDDKKELAVIDRGEISTDSSRDEGDVGAIELMLSWEYKIDSTKEPRSRELAEKIYDAYPDADWIEFSEHTMPKKEVVVQMAKDLGINASPHEGPIFKAPDPEETAKIPRNPLSTRQQAAAYATRSGGLDPYGTGYEKK